MYTHSSPRFEYEDWLQALRDGRTFITNGAALSITVNGQEPGAKLKVERGTRVEVEIEWKSHYPVGRVDLVHNGRAIKTHESRAGGREGVLDAEVVVESDGWLAARLGSNARDSFAQALWAHTSPVYLDTGGTPAPERARDASWLVDRIDESLSWISSGAKFYTDAQRREVLDLFAQGRDVYKRMG